MKTMSKSMLLVIVACVFFLQCCVVTVPLKRKYRNLTIRVENRCDTVTAISSSVFQFDKGKLWPLYYSMSNDTLVVNLTERNSPYETGHKNNSHIYVDGVRRDQYIYLDPLQRLDLKVGLLNTEKISHIRITARNKCTVKVDAQ